MAAVALLLMSFSSILLPFAAYPLCCLHYVAFARSCSINFHFEILFPTPLLSSFAKIWNFPIVCNTYSLFNNNLLSLPRQSLHVPVFLYHLLHDFLFHRPRIKCDMPLLFDPSDVFVNDAPVCIFCLFFTKPCFASHSMSFCRIKTPFLQPSLFSSQGLPLASVRCRFFCNFDFVN